MNDNNDVHIHQGLIVFRFLAQPDFTPSQRLIGAIALLQTAPKKGGYVCRKTRPEKIAELSDLPIDDVGAALIGMATAGWLTFFENPDGSWGYSVREERLEEVRAKRREYIAASRAKRATPPVTVHPDGTAEVVFKPGVEHG